MRKIMQTLACALAVVAVQSASASNAQDAAIEWTWIHEGGLQGLIRPNAFEVWSNGLGSLTDNGFSLRTLDEVLPGCYVKSPMIPVPKPSDVSIFPGVNVIWDGMVHRTQSVDAGVTTVVVELRSLDGRVRRQVFDIGTGKLSLRVSYIDGDNIAYRGTLDTDISMQSPLAFRLKADEPAEMRVSMCNLFEGSRVNLRDLAVQMTPRT